MSDTIIDTVIRDEINTVGDIAARHFALGHNGDHGVYHWLRVATNGLALARLIEKRIIWPSDGDDIIRLFALTHDCCRVQEIGDQEHGPRAAKWLESFRGKIPLGDESFKLLYDAVNFHTTGHTHVHPVIGACWDSDRLDIGRVGYTPSRRFFSTPEASGPAIMKWALDNSRKRVPHG